MAERLSAIFDVMAQHEMADPERGDLCLVAAEVLHVNGAAIGLSSPGQPLTSFCSNVATSQSLMDLEITLGEGPCTDACVADVSVEEGDLPSSTIAGWVAYIPMAVELGARAVFAFPVHIGVIRIGALSLFHDQPGELTELQSVDGYLMASVIAHSLVALQAGAPRGSLSLALQREAMFDFSLHQAVGMIAVQGAMTVEDALIVLRMRAFATEWPLANVAAKVIARRLTYEPLSRTWEDLSS